MHLSSLFGTVAMFYKTFGSTSSIIGFHAPLSAVINEFSLTIYELARERMISSGFSATSLRDVLRLVERPDIFLFGLRLTFYFRKVKMIYIYYREILGFGRPF